jgi:polysaccharide biosynthesis/export protein
MTTARDAAEGRSSRRFWRAALAWFVVIFLAAGTAVPAASREERRPAPTESERTGQPPAGRMPATQERVATEPTPEQEAAAGGHYRIGPEDMLQITVWQNDAMSRIVPVRPDGYVSLPLVNDVRAAGLTPMELRSVLIQKLSDFISAPEVSVIVTDVRSFKVSVIGEVARPGRYELKSDTTALDVLAAAGGFTSFATRSRIMILRPNGDGMDRIPFNYNRLIALSADQTNYYLQPGDIVLVP